MPSSNAADRRHSTQQPSKNYVAQKRRSAKCCLLILSLIAVGCNTGGSGAGANDTGAGQTAGSSQEDSGGNEQSQIVLGIGAEPRSLDPALIEDGQRDAFNFSVYEGLTGRDSDDMEIVPLLARNWDVDSEGTTWTFELREDVSFHNGEPLTADDVVASYERVLNPDLDGERAGSLLGGVTEVNKVDDETVEIVTESPDPTVPARATLVVVAPAEWAGADSDRMGSEMMGTGPYQFVNWDRGQEITLRKYDDYWGGDDATITDVVIPFAVEDSVRLAGVQTGEVHIARNMPPDLASEAPKVVSGPLAEVSFLRLNQNGDGPFSDQRVREAANLAIDRETLIEKVYLGFAEPAQGQILTQFVVGSNPELSDHPYDPERARTLLEEAGPEAKNVSLSVTTGRWIKDREIGQAVAAMLGDVGFVVDAEFPEFSTWLEQLFVAGNDDSAAPDAMFVGHGNELFEPVFSLGLYIVCDGEASTYCNPDVDRLAQQASETVDDDARTEVYQDIWSTLHDDFAYVTVAQIEQVHFVQESVQWEPRPDGYILVQDIHLGDGG